MLVLSRQRDESIMIGDNIVVTIVDIRGDKVRLGINAPAEIARSTSRNPSTAKHPKNRRPSGDNADSKRATTFCQDGREEELVINWKREFKSSENYPSFIRHQHRF